MVLGWIFRKSDCETKMRKTAKAIGRSNFKKSFLPIYISFVFSSVELFTSDGDFDLRWQKFLVTNTFGLIVSLVIEVHKRWAAESRMAHFANHLPTRSPIFSELMELIERVDLAYKRIGEETLVERTLGSNPIEEGLSQTIREASSRIHSLAQGQVITPHFDNRLSITLSESVEIIRGISIAETDVPFWKSEQGRRYLQSQMKISCNHPNTEYSAKSEAGVFRIFCINADAGPEVKEMIVNQVRAGVNIALFRDDYFQELPQDELGIFGNICVRKTRFLTSRSSDSANLYSFSNADVCNSIEDFDVLWNRSTILNTQDYLNFSLAELERFV